jgi:hypothetical protein
LHFDDFDDHWRVRPGINVQLGTRVTGRLEAEGPGSTVAPPTPRKP